MGRSKNGGSMDLLLFGNNVAHFHICLKAV